MMPTVLRLGLRNLKLRKKRRGQKLAGTVAAIGLSLIPLVVVLEVANGMIEGITRRFIEIGTYHMQISLYGELDLDEEQSVVRDLAAVQGVSLAFAERQGVGLIRSARSGSGVQIRAVPPGLYQEDEGFRQYFQIARGAFDLSDEQSLLMGRAMASELGVDVGDPVRLLSSKTMGQKRPVFRISRFTVAGIFSTGYQDLDKSWVYIALGAARQILPDARRLIAVKVEDPFGDLRPVIAGLDDALSGGDRLYRINTWFAMEANQYGSFRTTKSLLILIMVLIVVVASVNVSSAMMMIVLEKTQEIGILKAMGASPATISLSFIVTGFATGVLGACTGIAAGLLLAVNINQVIRGIDFLLNEGIGVIRWLLRPFGLVKQGSRLNIMDPAFYLETIPIRIRWPEIAGVAFLSISLATLASLLPARRAGRIRPMDVLRRV